LYSSGSIQELVGIAFNNNKFLGVCQLRKEMVPGINEAEIEYLPSALCEQVRTSDMSR
jgi:hypothetical protein